VKIGRKINKIGNFLVQKGEHGKVPEQKGKNGKFPAKKATTENFRGNSENLRKLGSLFIYVVVKKLHAKFKLTSSMFHPTLLGEPIKNHFSSTQRNQEPEHCWRFEKCPLPGRNDKKRVEYRFNSSNFEPSLHKKPLVVVGLTLSRSEEVTEKKKN